MFCWFWSAAPELQSAFIGAAATSIAAGIGFSAVVWQIGRQNHAFLEQNRSLEVLRIRSRVYDELSGASLATVQTNARLSAFTQRFELDLNRAEIVQGSIPSARSNELVDLHGAMLDAHLHLLVTVERWRVVDPRIEVFMDGLNVAQYDLNAAVMNYLTYAFPSMPVEVIQGDILQLLPWFPPSQERKEQLGRLKQAVFHASWAYQMTTHDLDVEMQNELVSDLFQRGKVKKRRPIDPATKVITLEEHQALSDYFCSAATAWGREFIALEQLAREAMRENDRPLRQESA